MNLFLNADCMNKENGMQSYPDKYFELAIVDPPYGIGKFWAGGDSKNKGYRKTEPDWNQKIPDKTYFTELERVSQKQIIWGWNYYTAYFNPTNNLVLWDKCQSFKTNYSEFELAYCSWKIVCQIIKIPVIAKVLDNLNYHPCSKPIKLYKELLKRFAKQNDKILDSHVGSASSLIAFEDMGFEYVGYEIDSDYFRDANKRLTQFRSQYKMAL